MKSRSVANNPLPTLVVDPNAAAAAQLAAQLTRAAFPLKAVVTCAGAVDAVTAEHFRMIVVVAALDDPECLACLRALHRTTPQSWLIVISSHVASTALELAHRCGADSFVTAPFTVEDLVSRLAALSTRPQPF